MPEDIVTTNIKAAYNLSNVNAALAADNAGMGYGAFLARSFSMSSLDCKGGGLIGALLAWPLHKALDVWGGVIVMICASGFQVIQRMCSCRWI